jgi:membrane peptidoglycan carboxypeptidase
MASAFSALVNGGRLYRPKILAKTSPKDGEINDIQPMFLRRIISEETSKKVVRMLRTVTATDGSGKRAAIPGYPVAGKTGTAQSLADMHKVTEDLAGETTSKVIASFVGVVPADDPEVVIYVMFNRPKGEKYYGGQIAAPVFRELGEEILSYLKVKPRKEVVMPEQPYSAPWNAEDVRKQSQIDGVPSWLNLDVNEGRLAPAKPLHTEVAPATPAASVTKPENAEDVPPSWLVIPGAEAEENKEDDTLFMDLLMEEEASVWE